jgi:hypothetical protein
MDGGSMSQSGGKGRGFLLNIGLILVCIGALFVLGLIFGSIESLLKPDVPVGKALLKKHSDNYILLGERVVEKEIGAIFGTQMVPGLFIYLLQDRSDPHRLLVSVSQSHGFSIDQVRIEGSTISSPSTLEGQGKYWGERVSSKFTVPEKAYEKEVFVSSPKDGFIEVTVNYFWIEKLVNRSNSAWAVFPLRSK